ncbi:MAG TPA: nucleoside deaminase [Gemmatimonadaceae bacterium]|nr:nucleoside deaminase [Gemmatimonadaceae bacterium]
MTSYGEAATVDARRQQDWMLLALAQAKRALDAGEAPIGCALLRPDGTVIAEGHNTMVGTGIVTAHAEMNAFAAAADKVAPGRPTVLVSSLEPCVMCTGAAMQAGVTTIIYGLQAPADSGTSRVHPPESPGSTRPEIIGRIGADESRALFYRWLKMHAGDESRSEQRAFIEQLLELTQDGEKPREIAEDTLQVDA